MLEEDYMLYKVLCAPSERELITAFFGQYPFASFVEQEWGFEAYISASDHKSLDRTELNALPFAFEMEITAVEKKNWNAEWEANFDPVVVDDFCMVRAGFHPKLENIRYDLIVNPKMAFGTGHHETTFMMIQAMARLKLEGCSILDYGCGTGVLAILASKMGASRIKAIDYDINSVENTIENAELNNCKGIGVEKNELDQTPEELFDVILANINRNVLLSNAEGLRKRIKSGGILLLSGILDVDLAQIEHAYCNVGFVCESKQQRGEWMCLKMTTS